MVRGAGADGGGARKRGERHPASQGVARRWFDRIERDSLKPDAGNLVQ